MFNCPATLGLTILMCLAMWTSTVDATDHVSGVIRGTYIIVEDTDIVGDVTCDVGSNPCFSFGASDVELRLNGFTITGLGDAITGCGGAVFPNEIGITTNRRHNVGIRGPGLVQQFRHHGIYVIGSTNARVEIITASTNCNSGISVDATSFGTLVQGNQSVRNGTSARRFSSGGISVVGHNTRVRLNGAYGNGYAEPSDDFGIGVTGTATGTIIEENNVSGNTTGIFVGGGASRTTVRGNIVTGNPAVQVANMRPDARAADILNFAPTGQTTFERNICVTAVNAPCPAVTWPQL